jgi:hypothetical protein
MAEHGEGRCPPNLESENHWERYGFVSRRAWIAYLEREQNRYRVTRDPQVDLPPTDVQLPPDAAPPQPQSPERKRVRQLGLKLAIEDYDQLAAAAEAYGVTPTTLARMLVRRGARAMLRVDRAEGGSG